MSRLPDLEGKQAGSYILKRPGRWASLAAMLAEIVPVNLQRRTIGILVRESWNLSFPQNSSCYEPSARLLQAGTKVEMESDLAVFLHDFHLRIDSCLDHVVHFLGIWPGPVVIGIAGRFQR